MDRKEEFKQAIRETSRYLLSHHEPEDYYRCYSLSFFKRKVRLCARCSGIYPGIAAGLTGIILYDIPLMLPWVAITPLPTLIEKYLTGVRDYRGFNSVRTITGFILGFGYVNGLKFLLEDPANPYLLTIGLLYVISAALLIWKQTDRSLPTF